jgi:polyphosphate kinase
MSTCVNLAEINLRDPKYYFNRAISWIEFNRRVLQEAFDDRTPLLERLKFMAIFSNNLDEFFMVRVAGIKQQIEANIQQHSADGLTPQQQLETICRELQPLVCEQHRFFEQALRPLLAAQGIVLLRFHDLDFSQQKGLDQYFEEQIFPVLTPLAIDPAHPFPYISSLSLNLAVVVKDPQSGEERLARVKVPNGLPRFIPVEPTAADARDVEAPTSRHPHSWMGVPIEEVIAHNLKALFPGMNIVAYHAFRITRSGDLELETDNADDLLIAIEQEIRKRRFGSVVRLEIQTDAPAAIRQMLLEELSLQESDIYEVDGLLCLNSLFALRDLPRPDLQDPAWQSIVPARLQHLQQYEDAALALDAADPRSTPEHDSFDFFALIRERDLLVHHPYEAFAASVQRFITTAANDPQVLAIKMTLYRTSGDSPIVKALITAAENGKQVAALVELKARFDEENNILWARRLEKVGVHVVYGVPGLKTHAKTVMVVRREAGKIVRYVHLGTGNYNPKTARLYEDLGLFTCQADLGADLTDLFNVLTGYSRQRDYRKLLVAPVGLRERLLALIARETEHAQAGRPGRIIVKMNAITDTELIVALYQASQAGVKIDLIIRGMCCLRPGVEQVSDNIRVLSVIGRFLEHSRIFYFHNHENPEVFIGSADWRGRNLDRRVEVVTPIDDPKIKAKLRYILDVMLLDNRQAWELQPDGTYRQLQPAEGEPERVSQQMFMESTLETVKVGGIF